MNKLDELQVDRLDDITQVLQILASGNVVAGGVSGNKITYGYVDGEAKKLVEIELIDAQLALKFCNQLEPMANLIKLGGIRFTFTEIEPETSLIDAIVGPDEL